VFIRPEFQRRGVGSGLLRELMQEAQSSRLPLKLRVLKVNPAVHFYRRLGFAEVHSSAEHVYMAYAG
jgi:ribosomal protein S18 acetylase RimI-like enzyme